MIPHTKAPLRAHANAEVVSAMNRAEIVPIEDLIDRIIARSRQPAVSRELIRCVITEIMEPSAGPRPTVGGGA
jgi:hypothetical protein